MVQQIFIPSLAFRNDSDVLMVAWLCHSFWPHGVVGNISFLPLELGVDHNTCFGWCSFREHEQVETPNHPCLPAATQEAADTGIMTTRGAHFSPAHGLNPSSAESILNYLGSSHRMIHEKEINTSLRHWFLQAKANRYEDQNAFWMKS